MQHEGSQRRVQRSLILAILLAALALLPAAVTAASHDVNGVKTFGLLDFDATFTARYLFDDQEQESASDLGGFQTRTTWEEELFLMTKSFVYHPGFLNVDFGGGPVLVQQQFDSDLGDNRNNETLLNLLARLNFLNLKKYPFSFYYERSHPSVFTGLSGRFLTENNEYGFKGRIDDLWESTSLSVDLSQLDSQGAGAGAIIDEVVGSASVALVTSYRGSDRIQLLYDRSTRDSNSGNAGLPLQASRISVENAEVRALNVFGGQDQITIDQYFRRIQQDVESNATSTTDTRVYNGLARWDHSKATRSQLRYRLNEVKRAGSDSKSQNADVSVFFVANENLSYEGGVDYSTVQQVGFGRDRKGADGFFNYSRPTVFGSIGLSGSLRMEQSDQESSAATVRVFDESVVLNDTTPAELANEFVVTASVIVTNAARTQTFVEGLDYRLVSIGGATSVQRLINSNIADGETVLAEYEYQTSGTAEFDSLSSGVSLTANFLRNFTAFLRYNMRDTNIRSGELTTPVNDLTNFEIGLSASYPLMGGWTIGGQWRRDDQDEEISPFVSDTFDVNISADLPGSFKIFLSSSLIRVDNKNSVEDVNQVSHRLGITGRTWGGAQLSYEIADLTDTGGTLVREQLQHRLNLQWAYRQVRFYVRAQFSEDTLGATVRRYTQVTAQLTRTF